METKVLVVEDDVEINELLGEYLSLEDIKYVQALDGKAALQQAAAAHPDAMILDLMLPDIDGYHVAKDMLSHRRTYDIPIIMLTCMNQDCDKQKGLASGAHHYMNKPFLPDDLLANVQRAMDWKKTLATRPPQGRIVVSLAESTGYHQAINDMVRDLFSRTALSDHVVAQIKAGFLLLAEWALDWGKKHDRDPQLVIEYRITDANGNLAQDLPATAIHWVISELKSGLMDEMLFKPNVAIAAPSVSSAKENHTVSPLAKWFRFLAKCGIARFDKDAQGSRIELERSLIGNTSGVPVLMMDGTRVPTRVRHEVVRKG